MPNEASTKAYEVSAPVHVRQRAEAFQVAITYCNGVVMVHDHQITMDATDEYAERLAEAIEPRQDVPHIRQVSLLLFNEIGELIQHVDSGVFRCEHAA